MRTVLQSMIVLISGIVPLVGQTPYVDTYTNISSDSGVTTAYATGVMQVDMANTSYCQLQPWICDAAHHSYSQTVTITSPSRRTGSCSFSSGYPAIETVSLQCTAELALAGEGGTYSVQTNQSGTCTIAGLFLASIGQYVFSAGFSVTGYKNAGDVTGGSVFTYDPASCSCSCRAPNDVIQPESWAYMFAYETFIITGGLKQCSPPSYFEYYSLRACGDTTVVSAFGP